MINSLFLALTLASATSAIPLASQQECDEAYSRCIDSGSPNPSCSCAWIACSGYYDVFREQNCTIPSTLRPQPPGPKPTHSSVSPPKPVNPGGCNPANPGSCHWPKWNSTSKHTNHTHPTNIETMPSFFPAPVTATALPTAGSIVDHVSFPGAKPVDGEKWSILNLVRRCQKDGSRCEYTFTIQAGGQTEKCEIIRTPGSDAATESWAGESCTGDSDFQISWQYVTEPGPAYSIFTVVADTEVVWFGVPDINGQKVTPSNPFGSGKYGNLGPEQVYSF